MREFYKNTDSAINARRKFNINQAPSVSFIFVPELQYFAGYNKKNRFPKEVTNWPPRSTDLNPMDFFCGDILNNEYTAAIRTLVQLKENIRQQHIFCF